MTEEVKQPEYYDIIIIGAGAAGYTAGIYASRARLKTLVLDGMGGGGQMAITDIVENYPGWSQPISGMDLAEEMRKQMERFGTSVTFDQVDKVQTTSDGVVVHGAYGEYHGQTLLVATGAKHRLLGVPGEKELTGRGVSYCATCDGNFFRNQHVALVGGGDTAVKEAVYLSRIASKVTVIHRRDKLRAEKVIQEKALQSENIVFRWDTVVEEIQGEQKVQRLRLKHVKTDEESSLDADGVFIFVGILPNTEVFEGLIELDETGFIKTDLHMQTSHPRIWAAGDVRSASIRQIASAVGDAATATLAIQELLDQETPARENPKA